MDSIQELPETFLRHVSYWHDSIALLCYFCTFITRISIPITKGALLDWDLVTAEAVWVQWIQTASTVLCYLQETNWKLFKRCDWRVILLELPITHCGHEGMDMGGNVCQENVCTTITPTAWTVDDDVSCCSHQSLTLPSKCQSRDSSDQRIDQRIVQFW